MQAEAFDPHAPLGARRSVIRRAPDGIEMVELGWGLKPRDEDGPPFPFVRRGGLRFSEHLRLLPGPGFRCLAPVAPTGGPVWPHRNLGTW